MAQEKLKKKHKTKKKHKEAVLGDSGPASGWGLFLSLAVGFVLWQQHLGRFLLDGQISRQNKVNKVPSRAFIRDFPLYGPS